MPSLSKIRRLFALALLSFLSAPVGAEAAGPTAVSTFAGGCFWCMEPPFEALDGVVDVVSGYSGGSEVDPTYDQVSSGRTGHAEAVQVHYDPTRVSYAKLLDVFWRQVDPTDPGGQFVDRGRQYRTAIFVHDAEQRRLAEASKAELEASGRYDRPLVTEIVPFRAFYPAEEYHQDYGAKNPIRYKYYRYRSGRDQYLEKIWKAEPMTKDTASKYDKPSDEELRHTLTPLQYEVTQEDATERPFENQHWDEKRDAGPKRSSVHENGVAPQWGYGRARGTTPQLALAC